MNSSENRTRLEVPCLAGIDSSSVDDIVMMLEDSGARLNIDCVNWPEYPYKPLTVFSTAHTGRCLYFDFFVRCNYLRAINYTTNSAVHEDSSVVEALQTVGSDFYYCFVINCIGTIAGYICRPGKEPETMDAALLDGIKRSASCGNRPFQELEGLFSWNVLIGIPLEMLGVTDDKFPVVIRGNFAKCASGTSQPHFLTWQPVDAPKPMLGGTESFADIVLMADK